MKPALFRRFCEIARERAGILIQEGKESFVAARVGKRLRELGIESEQDYLRHLEDDESGEEIVSFLDVISTNHTSFFREEKHFGVLAEEVQRSLAAGRRRLRIWCAACSTGEEPYSVAMTVLEEACGGPLDLRILATDLSTRALARARAGLYRAQEAAAIPRALRARYFQRRGRPPGEVTFSARPELREVILFKRLNLAAPPFPMKGPFDLVFCRNVMIYFDPEVRQRLIAEIERLLRPGGLLLIGLSESLCGIPSVLRRTGPSVYRQEVERGTTVEAREPP